MSHQMAVFLQKRLDGLLADSGLPPELVEELTAYHTIVTYAQGSTIFLRGTPADLLFWVFTGVVEVYCPQADGGRVLVRICGSGDILGNVDFLDYRERRAQAYEAVALTKCEVALLSREHVFKLLRTLEPRQLVKLLEYVNSMWSSVAISSATFIGLDFRDRLKLVLADLAQRFGVQDSRGTLLITELSHAKLAEMIGSSRPMVTLLIGDMVEAGLLARRGKQYILLNHVQSVTSGAPAAEITLASLRSTWPSRPKTANRGANRRGPELSRMMRGNAER